MLKKTVIICCSVLLLIAVSCIVCIGVLVSQRWSLAEIDEAQRDTQPLIDALVAYRTDHGVYPDALSQLVPRYLKTIGRAPLGNPEWQYHPREDNQEFEIVFEEAPYGANCVYISRTGEWMCDTG